MSTFFQKLFGRSMSSKQRSSRSLSSRRLRLESLESRELLSVTLGSISDFDALRSQYSELNLSANQTDYGIIEIQGSDFTEQGLRTAVTLAGTTNKEDIIVFRTTASQNTLNLAAQVDISTATAALGTNMKGIIFVGLGTENLTINANNNRAFKISSVDVAFAGVNIENGRIATASTSVTALASLTATTTAGNGGAIYAQNSNLKIIDSTFSNNKSAGNYGSGGAIFCWGGSLTLTDSVFTANQTIATSASYGGAVYIVGANAAIENTVFNNNTGYYGGGITAGMGANISVSANSVFSHNNSTKEGAGIYVMNGQLTVADSEISQNNSQSHGAGIYQKVGALTMTNSVVAENKAVTSTSNPNTTTAYGGGIFAGGSVTVTDTTIIRDNFAGTGAGLYMDTNSTTMTIANSQIIGNTATHTAGGVFNGGTETTSTFTIQNSTITGNTAGTASLTTTSYYGGGVYSTAVLTVLQSTISNNTASGSGGGIYSTAQTTLTKATVNGNKSLVGSGGGLYTNDKAIISNVTFNENTAKTDGGGAYVGASSSIKSSYFQGNEALSDGGGIFATSTKSTLENSVIAGNHAAVYGGGVYGHFDSIINATIVGNIAEKAGGGWYMPSSTLAASVLTNSIFAYNVAKGTSSTYGGPDVRTVTANKLNVSYSLIYDQSAGNGKGYVNSGNNLAAMTNPHFVNFPTSAITTSTAWSSTLWRNWNLELSASSPAIDAGNNAVVTEIYDVRGYGYDRINNSQVDLGAYEFGSIPDPPSPPASVTANVTGSNVTLTWTAVTGATRYSIVRQNPDGSTESEIFINAPQLTYTDNNLSSGTYTYDVYSWIDSVKSQTANSDSVSIIPIDPILPSPKVIAVPSNDTVILTWIAITEADYYRVYQWDNVTHSLGTLLEDNITQLTWSQSGLADGTYWYAVQAVNGTTVSDVIPVEVVVGGLSTPVVTGTNPSGGTVQLVWSAIDEATHYTVSLLDSNNNETLLDANVTGTSWTDSSLPAGTYRYAVRAVDSNTNRNSGFNPVSVVVVPSPETLPTPNVTINVLSNVDVQITWTSVSTATHYEIQRRLFGNDTWEVLAAQWSGTTFVDTTAPEGNVEYAVRAVKGTTVSEPGVGSAFINRPPAAPVVTLSFNDQQKTVTVSWNTVPTADTYDVRRRVGGGEWVLLTDQYANTSFVDTNVPEGYVEYSVRAYEGIANVSNYIVQGITIDLPPAAPVVTTTIQSASETVKLTWNAISTAVYYSIERRIVGGTWETLSDEWDSTVFIDSNAPEGNIEYAVRAYESTGLVSGFNSVDIFVDWTVPAPEVTASVGDSGVTLTWATVSTATYYDVRRRTVGGTWTMLSEQWTSTTFIDSTAPEGIFEYSVRAYDGTTNSPFNGVLVEVDLPPAAPTVTVTIQPNEKVKLTWNAISTAVYYSIERRVDSGDWETLSDEWDSTIFIDSDVPEGNVEYAVRAYEESGLVSDFNSVDVLVDWAPATPVVTASVGSNGNVTLTWSAIYTATSYDVRRRVVGGSWVTLTDQLSATTFVDTTPPEGNVEYSVRAFDGTVLSGFTAVGVFIDAPPAAPTLSATVQNNGTVQLSWNAVTGAQSYELVRQSAGSTTLETVVSQWYGTSFVDAAPPDGNVVYLVRALEGTAYSEYGSASVYVTPPAIAVSNSSVTATTLSDQTVYLDWNVATNATGYNVFRRVAGTTTGWVQVNSQPLTDTEFVDAAPPLGNVEYYVTAIRGTNTSSYSTTSTTVGLANPVVTANVETSGEVTINWDTVNNASRYSVWVKVAGGTWTLLSNNAAGGSFVHTNPTVGTVQYAVKAHNGTVVSGFNAVTVNVPAPNSGTTSLPPFGAPVVNATLQSDGTVSITWGEVEDATRYSVWYQEAGGSWVSLSSNATGSFIHTNPPSGTVKYTVKAHNGTVASSFVAVTLSIP